MRKSRGRHVAEPVEAPRVVQGTPPALADMSVQPGGQRLGERLVAAGLATREDIEMALLQLPGRLGSRLGRLMVERGAITDDVLARVLADQHGVPTADLRVATPSAEALAAVDEQVARRLTLIPIDIDGDTLRVVVADPTPEAVAEASAAIGRPISVSVATPQDISSAKIGRAHV